MVSSQTNRPVFWSGALRPWKGILSDMPYKPLPEFVKGRVREILGKHGEVNQAPYYSFIRKIQSSAVKTYADLEKVVSKYVNDGLKREALEEIVPLVRSDLRVRKRITTQ